MLLFQSKRSRLEKLRNLGSGEMVVNGRFSRNADAMVVGD